MIAKGDVTYCQSKTCKGCWRHESNWEFEADRTYSFMENCEGMNNFPMKNVKGG